MKSAPFSLALVLFAVASTASAQAPVTNDSIRTSVDTVTAPAHIAVPSSMDMPSAVRRNVEPSAIPVPMAQSSAGLGQSKAMMIVGGAALITGAIVGGKPGTIIMVGGAVVGLYGLYKYLQ